ncbi:MAG: toxin [Candidatus Omnitrophica bacterium]|nr:toxin [Candidatus Omnitrophota bacterium]
MKELRWDPKKNIELKKTRNITFEQLINSRFIGIEDHIKKTHQKLMLFDFNKYVWVVPYVNEKDFFFLKTAFPSRKHTKKYLGEK